MCGRFTLADPDRLIAHYSRYRFPALKRSFNVAPTHDVVTLCDDAGEQAAVHSWGFAGQQGGLIVNARSETVHTKPMFRNAFMQQRCVVFADSYYEWMTGARAKRPFRFTLQDGMPFAFAAMWEPMLNAKRAVCLLTTHPNEKQRAIHDRSPVMLINEASIECWLNRTTQAQALRDLCRPPEEEAIQSYEVSQLVNSVSNDDERCIAPFAPPEISLFGP